MTFAVENAGYKAQMEKLTGRMMPIAETPAAQKLLTDLSRLADRSVNIRPTETEGYIISALQDAERYRIPLKKWAACYTLFNQLEGLIKTPEPKRLTIVPASEIVLDDDEEDADEGKPAQIGPGAYFKPDLGFKPGLGPGPYQLQNDGTLKPMDEEEFKKVPDDSRLFVRKEQDNSIWQRAWQEAARAEYLKGAWIYLGTGAYPKSAKIDPLLRSDPGIYTYPMDTKVDPLERYIEGALGAGEIVPGTSRCFFNTTPLDVAAAGYRFLLTKDNVESLTDAMLNDSELQQRKIVFSSSIWMHSWTSNETSSLGVYMLEFKSENWNVQVFYNEEGYVELSGRAGNGASIKELQEFVRLAKRIEELSGNGNASSVEG